MKKVLFLIFLFSCPAYSGGPLFDQKDTYIQQEFENVYRDLKSKAPSSGSGFAVLTGTQTFSGLNTILSGGTTVFTTTQSGAVLQPLQPSFLTHLNANQNNVTGDGTVQQIVYNDEIYDQGNNVVGATFTAPVNGRYLLSTNIKLEGIATTHTSVDGYIVTSNRSYIVTFSLTGTAAITEWSVPITVVADMDAGDIAYVQVAVNGSGKTADISGAASFRNIFSGSLLN